MTIEVETDPTPQEPERDAGWYPDHLGYEDERFWNGKKWTGRTRSSDPEVEIEHQDDQLMWAGAITAIVLPLIGFVLGVILAARARRIGTAVAIMLAAIVMSGVWTVLYVEWLSDVISETTAEQVETPSVDDSSYLDDYYE